MDFEDPLLKSDHLERYEKTQKQSHDRPVLWARLLCNDTP